MIHEWQNLKSEIQIQEWQNLNRKSEIQNGKHILENWEYDIFGVLKVWEWRAGQIFWKDEDI